VEPVSKGELRVVDARCLEVHEGVGVVPKETLDAVVLEQGDVRQAGAARLQPGGDLRLDVLGHVDVFYCDIRMGLVVDRRSLLHRVAVEVRIPPPYRDLLLREDPGDDRQDENQGDRDDQSFFHVSPPCEI
jgi:hypothetical protein